jgi:hypothetical protein
MLLPAPRHAGVRPLPPHKASPLSGNQPGQRHIPLHRRRLNAAPNIVPGAAQYTAAPVVVGKDSDASAALPIGGGAAP